VAAAEVQSAQAALKLAQVALSETELRAPFASIVAALDLKVGEYVAPGAPAVYLADLSVWQIETTDLTELNIMRVSAGSQAAVTFDAIPGLELLGRVSHIRGWARTSRAISHTPSQSGSTARTRGCAGT
jgi:HlyD family secretion protein